MCTRTREEVEALRTADRRHAACVEHTIMIGRHEPVILTAAA